MTNSYVAAVCFSLAIEKCLGKCILHWFFFIFLRLASFRFALLYFCLFLVNCITQCLQMKSALQFSSPASGNLDWWENV